MDQRDKSPAPRPSVASPVTGLAPVRDIARSVAFYRDVLQFDKSEPVSDFGRPRGVEVIRGDARLHLYVDRDASPAILFFETNDPSALRTAIETRGGMPSEIQRVTWINVEMFEVRDLDGNILWFGQLHGGPGAEEQSMLSPGMRRVIPELPLNDVRAGIEHYRDVFGFNTIYESAAVGFMNRDKITVALIVRTGLHTGISSFYVHTENVDELHAELKSRGAIVSRPPSSHAWGVRDFIVQDLEGNRIRFGQRIS